MSGWREHLLYLGGAKGGATVGLYQNGGYDEPLQMRLGRSPQRALHRPDLFPHTPAYDFFPCMKSDSSLQRCQS